MIMKELQSHRLIDKVELLRTRLNLRRYDMWYLFGVSHPTYYSWLRRDVSDIKHDTVKQVCIALIKAHQYGMLPTEDLNPWDRRKKYKAILTQFLDDDSYEQST